MDGDAGTSTACSASTAARRHRMTAANDFRSTRGALCGRRVGAPKEPEGGGHTGMAVHELADVVDDLVADDAVGTPQDLVNAMEATHDIHVSEVLLKHVVDIVERTRNHPDLEMGCSPRAGISLLKASRARALIQGRDYAIPEDIFALAEDVCLHRIRLSYEALAEGKTPKAVLQQILTDSIS